MSPSADSASAGGLAPDVARSLSSAGYGMVFVFGVRAAGMFLLTTTTLARAHGHSLLWITCNPDNLASRRSCERLGAQYVDIVPVPRETAPAMYPLVRAEWSTQQRSPARARAAGLPATPFEVTAADVLAWDRERGEPPLDTDGFTPEQEQAALSRQNR